MVRTIAKAMSEFRINGGSPDGAQGKRFGSVEPFPNGCKSFVFVKFGRTVSG